MKQHDRSETDLWRPKLLIEVLMRHVSWSARGSGHEEVVVAMSPATDEKGPSRKKGADDQDQKPCNDEETWTTVPSYTGQVGEWRCG